MRRLSNRPRGVLAAGLMACCGLASASGLQVAPIGLEFAGGAQAQPLWLTNTGTEVLHAQVRAFNWTQSGCQDRLSPASDLIASPPIIAIPPGGRQLVRVIRSGVAPASAEQAYRLLVDELPSPRQEQSGIRYVLRYSVPVFADPANPTSAAGGVALHWSRAQHDGRAVLQSTNTGTAHARISRVTLTETGGKPATVTGGLLGYVLPGSTMCWPLDSAGAKSALPATLEADVNGKPAHQDLPADSLPR